SDQQEFWEMRVRPVLVKNCFPCHTESRLGGLTMSSRESLLAGGNSGPAIAPGNPDGSLLIQAVRRTHPRIKMPPTGQLSNEPVAPADKVTLIRRATLDLQGLPPTPTEVDAFVKDSSPDAFAKVIDRLLASPRYGERWGRYWLDVARYSDDQLDATKDVPLPN